MGLVNQDNRGLLLNDGKLYSATRKMAQMQLSARDERIKDGVSSVYMDSRIDKVNLSHLIDGKNFTEKGRKDHYVMVEEPKGELLGIFTPKLSDEISKAEAVAECAIQKLESMGVDLSNLSALGGDSTVSNTGYKGGAFTLIEKKLGRRLNWIVCLIHVLGKGSSYYISSKFYHIICKKISCFLIIYFMVFL